MSELKAQWSSPLRREYTAKVALTLVFLVGVGTLSAIVGAAQLSRAINSLNGMDLFLFSLATFRLGRLVAFDRVMEPFRRPFTRTVPDSSGVGEAVEPWGEGASQAIGQLLSCPICAGTWIAAGLLLLYIWFPDFTRLFLWMMAAIGLAEVLQAVTEALSWAGQLNRTLAGKK